MPIQTQLENPSNDHSEWVGSKVDATAKNRFWRKFSYSNTRGVGKTYK